MGLLANGFRDGSGVYQTFGGTVSNNAYPGAHFANWHRTGAMRNLTAGEGITSELVGLPSGARHPIAWMLPQKAGALSSHNLARGSSTASLSLASGRNLSATADGSSTASASLQLVVSMQGTADGAATASGTLQAALGMVGSSAGSCAASAIIGALAWATGSAAGSSTATLTPYATGRLYGSITPFTELSPQSLAASVWTTALASYADTGNAALALQTAGSGGVDYEALWASMPTALKESLAAYTLAAAQTTPIHADMRKTVGTELHGDGTETDKFRSILVP